ncbi:thiazole tautomerase TenI [Priestia endophytica]|uniref:thiazole tautomerase TenI n=1 Tax=Priestia filamentosa TaxID=1402861 RepID=UPI002E22EC54|nr:thiazole tautomerase TenI [Priestia filamentosa]
MAFLYAVTSGEQPFEKIIRNIKSIDPYVELIQIREKKKTAHELNNLIDSILKQGISPAKLIVNDRVDIALVRGLRGVHLAYHSLSVKDVKKAFPHLYVGKSVHSLEEAKQSEQDGADYVVFGHLYETSSKQGKKPRGVQELAQIVEELSIPVIGIGGINISNIGKVKETNAAGIALMSGLFQTEAPGETARACWNLLNGSEHCERV